MPSDDNGIADDGRLGAGVVVTEVAGQQQHQLSSRRTRAATVFRGLTLLPSSDGDEEEVQEQQEEEQQQGESGPSMPPSPSQQRQRRRHNSSNLFLPGLHVVAHVLSPLRRALVHFHVSRGDNSGAGEKGDGDFGTLETRTLQAFGRLFQEMMMAVVAVTPATSQAQTAQTDGATIDGNIDGTDDDGSGKNDNDGDNDDSSATSSSPPAVDAGNFLDILTEFCVAHGIPTDPPDATAALQTLLEVVRVCTSTLPVTSRLWAALLDECGMGLIARKTVVGRLDGGNNEGKSSSNEIVQRTRKESCILYCPLPVPLGGGGGNNDSNNDSNGGVGGETNGRATSLAEALEKYCSRQPILNNNDNNNDDFASQPYDFEVRIPSSSSTTPSTTAGGTGEAGSSTNNTRGRWQVTSSLQFTSLPAYLFLGIQRRGVGTTVEEGTTTSTGGGGFDYAELEVPPLLDMSRLCAPQRPLPQPSSSLYRLVGGILLDEGDYVAVLRDEDVKDDENENAWKLMETDEVIPMSQGDVLDFLKGGDGTNTGGGDDNRSDSEHHDGDGDGDGDDENDEGSCSAAPAAPCGTLAVYRRVTAGDNNNKNNNNIDPDGEVMNRLLSDIILSEVSGTVDSEVDYYYYEEEVIEE